MKILVGGDPEVFVKKDGKFVSAYGLVEGTKEQPLAVPNGAVQVDGMALEFNINPASTCDEFVYNIEDVMETLKAMVPEYELSATPVVEFDAEYMKKQPEEAVMLGCGQDFNAWTSTPNPTPDAAVNFRTGAGHVHIGWTNDKSLASQGHIHMGQKLVKQLDFYLGLPSVMYDNDSKRRELYGKAGAYRLKPYGVEYRVLSNAWLNSKELMQLVYNNTLTAISKLAGGKELTKQYGDIQHIINSSNKDAAVSIMQAEGIHYEV